LSWSALTHRQLTISESKDLATHNVLDRHGLVWLENLDLRAVEEGEYFLVALPLKFMDLRSQPSARCSTARKIALGE
jgi:kynurenine formamidase